MRHEYQVSRLKPKIGKGLSLDGKKKTFETVKFFQNVKKKIAKETKGMSFVEFKEYLEKHKLKQ